MERKISQRGNSLAFTFPPRILDSLGWEKGDTIEIEVFKKCAVLKKDSADTYSEVLKTIAAAINHIMFNREMGEVNPEVEKELLRVISFGCDVLLDEDDRKAAEDVCLKMAHTAINLVLDRYGPRKD